MKNVCNVSGTLASFFCVCNRFSARSHSSEAGALSLNAVCIWANRRTIFIAIFFLLLEYALFFFIFLTFLQFRICYAVLNKSNNSFIFIFLCFFSSEFQNQHIQEHQIQQNHQQNNQNNQHIQIQSQPATNKRGKGGADAKPRGRMTAYAFFVQTCREEHKKKHPEETVIFAEFSRKCAERWKVCTISLFLLYFGPFFLSLKNDQFFKNIFLFRFIDNVGQGEEEISRDG